MTLKLIGEILGLGSVVRLVDDSSRGLFVVLARGALRPDSDLNEVIPRYLVGPHPYGEAPDRETFPILASEVYEVVHEGYTDAADDAFVEDLLDQMENGRRVTTPAQQFKEALTAIQDVGAVEVEDGDPVVAGGDPFIELRRLVGQEHRKDE